MKQDKTNTEPIGLRGSVCCRLSQLPALLQQLKREKALLLVAA